MTDAIWRTATAPRSTRIARPASLRTNAQVWAGQHLYRRQAGIRAERRGGAGRDRADCAV